MRWIVSAVKRYPVVALTLVVLRDRQRPLPLAAPVAFMGAMSHAAGRGIIVEGGGTL